jgi:NADH-quinone oxidoreductase subunit M
MLDSYLISLTIFSPFMGIFIILFQREESKATVKLTAIITSILTFAISLLLYFGFDPNKTGFQFLEQVRWIDPLNVSYSVGIDGISLLLVVLTTFLTPLALLSSWDSVQERLKGFVIMVLLLEVGLVGVFCSMDLFLLYVFWELILIPMYFIIGVWGGQARVYAAVKFFIYTMLGSLLMLVAIIWLGYYASVQPGGHFTTNLPELCGIAPHIPIHIQSWMFLAFALSFAIKVPIFPLHTWLPDAHVEAPTAGSVILAGVLLKMGTYGLLRFCLSLFPYASIIFSPYIATLAVIGIIYGALVSMVQPDLKKLVAYSSISHMGFVVLGIFSMTVEGMQGSVIQMVNHGLSTGALFIIVGMLYERRHTRMISDFGGLARQMPVLATFFMIISLSSMGLPGLNGFVGEFLILLGSFKSTFLPSYAYAILASSGVVLSAVYILWMYQRVMFGPLDKPANLSLRDLSKREWAVLIPIVLFVFWIGIYPSTFLGKSEVSIKQVVEKLESARSGGPIGISAKENPTRPPD